MPPNAKPVELAPNAGLAVLPKLEVVVTAAVPKAKGAGAGAGLEAGVADAPPTPKVKGFGAGAADEPNVD